MTYGTRIQAALFLLSATLLFSCSSSRKVQMYLEKSACTHRNVFDYGPDEVPRPIHEIDIDTVLSNRLSFESLHLAHSIGILDLLSSYVRDYVKKDTTLSLEQRIARLELTQRINQKIDRASLEISSVSSELDCEDERIMQVAEYMHAKEKKRETRLTVTAIVVGAAGAIASGILLLNSDHPGDVFEYVGIATGATEATLGVLILTNKQKLTFRHERNALRELWEGKETSRIFPPFVWYYLKNYKPVEEDGKSIRNQIIERWVGFDQIDESAPEDKSELIELYFGNGGEYDTDQLFNRANMYDQVESYINLLKQDLATLSIEIERLRQ